MTQPSEDLRREFGDLDIYLFDQLHRGRIVQGMTVLDAGCGGGRNLTYLLRRGFDIWGTDRDEKALASARANAATFAPFLPAVQWVLFGAVWWAALFIPGLSMHRENRRRLHDGSRAELL